MSSVDKLLIRGIRSFSPYNENVIEFYAPLTIIVGHNGAGKTTIIECLKYATTGDLPPNAKGGAFVHDPKVSRETEVKGQIKLKFRNVKGQTMVVTRSMQSAQRRSKLEQKTLESLLVTNDPATGEQVSISSRCAEMDAEIPLQLGVSRAVLENVIFCHQEESFWPLSEPGLLKKKFDDIFAATRYTRALDALKAIRKDLANELRLEQQKLEYLRADKDKASRIQLEIEKGERRCEQGLENVAAIDAQMTTVKQTMDSLAGQLQALGELQAEMEMVQHDIDSTRRSQHDLAGGMQPMDEATEQLQTMLEQLARRTSDDAEALEGYRDKRRAIEARLSEESQHFSNFSTRVGVLEAELGRLGERKASLAQMLQGLKFRMDLDGDLELSLVLQTAQAKVEGQRCAVQKMQAEMVQRQSLFNQQAQALAIDSSALSESKRVKKRTAEEARRRLTSIMGQLKELAGVKDRADELQQQLLEEEALLRTLRQMFTAASYEARLEALNQQRLELTRQVQEVNELITASARHSEDRARLDLKRTELQGKRELMASILGEVQLDLDRAAGFPVPAVDAGRESDRLWRLKERQLRVHQERQSQASQTAGIAASKCEQARAHLAAKERELADKQRRLQKVCGEEDFGICLEDAENELVQLSTELASSLSSKSTYEAFSRNFGKHRGCPLCERTFDTLTEEEAFGRRLAQLIESLPGKATELHQRKRELETRLAELRALRSVNDDIDRLRLMELPALEDQIKSLDGDRDRAQAGLDDLNSEGASIVLEERQLAALKRRCEELGRLGRECEALEIEVRRGEEEMNALGATFDIAEGEERLCQLSPVLQETTSSIEALNGESKLRQAEIQTHESRYHETKEQLMRTQLKQSELAGMEQSQQDLESQIASADREVSELDEKIGQLVRDEGALREQVAAWKSSAEGRIETGRETLRVQEEQVRECAAVEAEIDR